MASLRIAGYFNLSGSSLRGSAHVSGSPCFDPLMTIQLTGSVSSRDAVQISSAPIGGQILTLIGIADHDSLSGNYSVAGGCADGDQGSVRGSVIGQISILNGTFTSSSGQTFGISGNIAQNANPNPDGSYGINGTAAFTGNCLNSGTLTAGGLQFGNYIIGTSVSLNIQTENGTLVFLGVLQQTTGEIDGKYILSGGSCDQSGTAALNAPSSPWDYGPKA
jgi:hypothetical protein